MTISYPYRPKLMPFFLGMSFFGICTAILAYMGMSNEGGLVINGIISLSAKQASMFFYAMALASLGMVGVALITIFRSRGQRRNVELRDRELVCPKSGMSSTILKIPYADITELDEQVIQHSRFLYVHYPEGKFSIPQNMLASKEQFQELVTELSARVASSQSSLH